MQTKNAQSSSWNYSVFHWLQKNTTESEKLAYPVQENDQIPLGPAVFDKVEINRTLLEGLEADDKTTIRGGSNSLEISLQFQILTT